MATILKSILNFQKNQLVQNLVGNILLVYVVVKYKVIQKFPLLATNLKRILGFQKNQLVQNLAENISLVLFVVKYKVIQKFPLSATISMMKAYAQDVVK